MASNGTRRPPLVADRRAPAPRAQTTTRRASGSGKSGGAGGGKGGSRARGGGGGRPPRRPGNPILRFLRNVLKFVWRIVWGFTWRMTLVVTLVMAVATGYFYTTLPDNVNALLDGRARGSVTMRDADGEVFAWRGESFGGFTHASDVSEHLRNAVVASEDRRFYWHFGVSPRGIAGAIASNIAAGRGPFRGAGGSTLTQQVAKLLCLGRDFDPDVWSDEAAYEADCREGTVWRKIQELPYAFALELHYSKDEILSIYLNRAFLGASSRGFEAAAERYFGISARDLNPQQAAMLAGLLPAPSYYAPTRNLERAQNRAAVVLGLMHDQGYLTDEEFQRARANPATLHDAAESHIGGYFADWVMQTGPAYLTRDTTEDVVIQTTLDQRIQRAAEEAVAAVFDEQVREGSEAEAAVVVMSADGAVRAMVGGRSYTVGGFNRAFMAQRQTGSAFKPFVYALAMDDGYQPFDLVEDAPLTITVPGSGPWSPRNYTNDFLGMMTLAEALARSQNIPAVRISEAMGRERVRQAANAFGLNSDMAEGPALALGASESTLLDMTAAYAGILNGGSSVRPYGFTSLTLAGESAPLMTIGSGIGERVISEDAAQRLIWMMHQVIVADYGTGRRARLPDGREAAGKTGTTTSARDAWFVGFTADFVVGVWMGNDDNAPLTGVTGGGLPAEIWRETMVRINQNVPLHPLPMIEPRRPSADLEPPATRGTPGTQLQGRGGSLGDAISDLLGGILGN
ncbi:glycosyl transferase [Pararhodobacter marinus]|uniref:peptidoglycan glycosyltransferase n=3 Tax=Pararhodobacter marinus TaxID=2184063 RepID=A0A2U2CCP5_9RHOB|nr:transglycosylase domain-containing protein [Pararhodobacter marinus]PWE29611.1 glycosyl transferase [Pararhodobacter marinus]